MMTKEELKALGLADEQIEKVVEDYGKNYVPKNQFNQKNEELKQAKESLTTMQSDIEALKKTNADNAELAKQIDEMKAAQVKRDEEYTAQIHKMEVDGIVERTLMTFKAKNGKAVRALLDLEDVKLKDGTIKGLDDQLTKLKESDPYLFESESKPTGVTPGEPHGGQGSTGITQEQFNKMGYLQRAKLKEDDPNAYSELTNGGNE
jgi:phage minor structural protein GP20|nr:MAG TPA: minor structural protein [Caudoviricetes sp.]